MIEEEGLLERWRRTKGKEDAKFSIKKKAYEKKISIFDKTIPSILVQISLRYPSKNNHWATHTAIERWHKTAMPETHEETSVQTHMPATTTYTYKDGTICNSETSCNKWISIYKKTTNIWIQEISC